MGESDGKLRKRYVDRLLGELKFCLICGLVHSSGRFKVQGELGGKYAKGNPTKDHRNHPVPRGEINRRQGKNIIGNNVVDEILLNEAPKVSAARDETELLDSDYDDTVLYQVERIVLEETKENLNDVSVRLNASRKFIRDWKLK